MWLSKTKWLLALVFICLLSGCAGRTIVDFKVQLEVNYVDAQQQKDTAPVSITEMPGAPTLLSPFPPLRYQDSLLSWGVFINSSMSHYSLANLSTEQMIINWDQALVSSSQQLTDRPLLSAFYFPFKNTPLRQYIEPDAAENYAMALRYGELFQSGRLFDVQYIDGKTHLYKSGIGEWLLIKLPIQVGDKRLIMHIKLTALEASTRITYS